MDAPSGAFTFTRLERIVFGPGKLAQLGAELDRLSLRRAVVVTGASLGRSALLGRVTSALGPRCAGVFAGAAQHVPADSVRALTRVLIESRADAVVSFGGGSPIDTAKAAVASVLTGRDMAAEAGELDFDAALAPLEGGRPLVHLALPTTLSAGEYTPGGGVTDMATGIKRAVIDPRLQPRVIINDPELTLETPEQLWVSTGIRALDHAVETAYSRRHQIFTDTLAAKAIGLLVAHLPGSIAATGEAALAHRGHCQIAAWFSLFGVINTGMGISHALGHQIGPRWNVPHGVTSCITLPHAMRFMAGLAPGRFAPIAEGLGLAFDPADPRPAALAAAERVGRFIAGFAVPRSLEAAGVGRDELPEIVARVGEELAIAQVTDRPIAAAELAALLAAAWPRDQAWGPA